MRETVDLGWSLARIDTSDPSIEICTPYNSGPYGTDHIAPQYITIRAKENIERLRDVLNRLFPR